MIELLKVNDNRVNGTMRDISGDSFVCRVQYLNDLDPFVEYNVREPPRPLYHTFNTTIPLSYQIAAVHRLLQAPHRMGGRAHSPPGVKWLLEPMDIYNVNAPPILRYKL